MSNDFDIVKSQVKLSEVVPGLCKKMPSGIRYKTCPICGGEYSFSIMLPGTKGNSCEIFKCFKCDNYGSIIDYYCLINGLNPKDKRSINKALTELKKEYNIDRKFYIPYKHECLNSKQKNLPLEKKINYDFTDLAYELHENLINKKRFFVPIFSGDEYKDMATSYYIDRGLSVEVIKKFKLGYHSCGMNAAFKEFPNLRIKEEKDFYEYFIPFYENGKCTYILPRFSDEKYDMYKDFGLLETDEKIPKIMNLRGIPSQIFNLEGALRPAS